MSLETNKEVVREFLERMPSGAPEFFALMTDDVTWWVPLSVPLGGLYEGKESVRGSSECATASCAPSAGTSTPSTRGTHSSRPMEASG